MIAIGVGCRKGCSVEAIVALIEEAVAHLPPGCRPEGLFTIEAKRGEAGLAEAAARLDLPLSFLGQPVLSLAAGRAHSCSRRVEEMVGLPSVAETAALAGAGPGAVLLVPRLASPTATCAIAGPA